jgi:hypothetical protein
MSPHYGGHLFYSESTYLLIQNTLTEKHPYKCLTKHSIIVVQPNWHIKQIITTCNFDLLQSTVNDYFHYFLDKNRIWKY